MGDAGFAVVAERGEPETGRDRVQVGVVQDDGGGLAAQLQADALELLARDRSDSAPGRGRAGEGDLADAGVGDEILTGRPACGQNGDDPPLLSPR
jgi:hypothetical protein